VGRAMIVSWVTVDEPGKSLVHYWSDASQHKRVAKGNHVTYRYFNYSSGFIHHCTLRDLEVRGHVITATPNSCLFYFRQMVRTLIKEFYKGFYWDA